jgi:formylglycine-generating enzyme required for sulfatase activity
MKKGKPAAAFVLSLMLFVLLFHFTGCTSPVDPGTKSQPPAAPYAPSIKPGYEKLTLRWDAVSGASGYEIYFGSSDETENGNSCPAEPFETTSAKEKTITGLTNGTTYYIWLKAKNNTGSSGLSQITAGTPALLAPAPSVIRGNGVLEISWPAENGMDAYQIWHGTSENSGDAVQWGSDYPGTGIITGIITGLTNGVSHSVWLKVKKGTETSNFSPRVAEKPEVPKTPDTGFAYVPGGTITGSDFYAFNVTVPDNPAYTAPGTSSLQRGVFIEGRVVSSDSFAIAIHETTQQLWWDVQDYGTAQGYTFQNPKTAPSDPNKYKPVVNINWRDAMAWCNAYSEKMGKQPVYRDSGNNILKDATTAAACDAAIMDKDNNGFRLPTEVEREYAARGGNPAKADWMYTYAGSNSEQDVWYFGTSMRTPREVGGKPANCLGIYDLSGNVQEWGWDWMNYNIDVTTAIPPDGAFHNQIINGWNAGNQRPMAGGGVGSNPTLSCVSYRWGYTPDYKDAYVGFRVVCKVGL